MTSAVLDPPQARDRPSVSLRSSRLRPPTCCASGRSGCAPGDCAPACRRSAWPSASPRWSPCSASRRRRRKDLQQQIRALGTNLLQVQAGEGFGRGTGELPDTAVAMVSRIGPVTAVSSLATVDATVRRTDLVSRRHHRRHLGVRHRRRPASTLQHRTASTARGPTTPPRSTRRWCSARSRRETLGISRRRRRSRV